MKLSRKTIFAIVLLLAAAVLISFSACEKAEPAELSQTHASTLADVFESATATAEITAVSTASDTDNALSSTALEPSSVTTSAISDGTAKSTTLIPSSAPTTLSVPPSPTAAVKHFCTITINCSSVLSNISELDRSKLSIIPSDGILLPVSTVEFTPGESCFDILLRETRNRKIHMEYSGSPSTAYIEGIGNLYEFDCGALSGWEFRINGEFPSCSSGAYTVSDGDGIEFIYTCDLGADIGNS